MQELPQTLLGDEMITPRTLRSTIICLLTVAIFVGTAVYTTRSVLKVTATPTNVGTTARQLYRIYDREVLPPNTIGERWTDLGEEWHYRTEHFGDSKFGRPGTSNPTAISRQPARVAIQWILTEFSVQQDSLAVVSIRSFGGNDPTIGLTEVAVVQRVDDLPDGVSFVTCGDAGVVHAIMKLHKYKPVSNHQFEIIDPESEFGSGGPALLPQSLILGASMEYGKISGLTHEAFGPFWDCRSYERGANHVFAFEAIRHDSLIDVQRRSLLEQSADSR